MMITLTIMATMITVITIMATDIPIDITDRPIPVATASMGNVISGANVMNPEKIMTEADMTVIEANVTAIAIKPNFFADTSSE